MLQGVKQTTYQCRQESLGDRPVHVISIFGNHWAPATHVTVRENSSAAYTLVLVSYHSVTWALNLPINSSLDKGYVVSCEFVTFLEQPATITYFRWTLNCRVCL